MTATKMPRLTSLNHGAGCACKLSPDELNQVLFGLSAEHPDLLVDLATGDAAAGWRRRDGTALVATTDFFTPIVDDPATWGRIAAANAVSDIFAMGARPLFALNILGWPRALPFEALADVLAGAAEMADKAGYLIVGGHSIDATEPIYGQAVIGELSGGVSPLTNANGRSGHALVLSNAIGTGIATTAAKRTEPSEVASNSDIGRCFKAAVTSMTRLNSLAADVARTAEASACTDVTASGLLGHTHRLALASGVSAELDFGAIPLLPKVEEHRDAGFVPSGTSLNVTQAGRYLVADVPASELTLLADAQTSGGLLFACPLDHADTAVTTLLDTGHSAAIIGRLDDGPIGSVRVAPRCA